MFSAKDEQLDMLLLKLLLMGKFNTIVRVINVKQCIAGKDPSIEKYLPCLPSYIFSFTIFVFCHNSSNR